MSKSDYYLLIIEHMVAQGIEDSEQFMEFSTMILPMMSMQELAEQLEMLERLALG